MSPVSRGRAAVAAALLVAFGLAGVAACNPATSSSSGQPLVAQATDGAFVLELRSAQSTYESGEPIDVSGSLTYTGPDSNITIWHGVPPFSFGIIEPLGGVQLTPLFRDSCGPTTLDRDVPLTKGFLKSGAPLPSASISPYDLDSFMIDPSLQLPAGTWHVIVVAEFSVGACNADHHQLKVTLPITSR